MTPEARKAFLEAAQVCDNVARIAIEHDCSLVQFDALRFAAMLRSTVKLHEKRDEEADGGAQ